MNPCICNFCWILKPILQIGGQIIFIEYGKYSHELNYNTMDNPSE
jgi:hypothetical protein